ncbi:MAG: chemotaxis protein CheW [Hydrococcus sp. Prado102]|nr:chemotaxis protein CheW [Hydrococcus sp. Prado102]
MRYGIEANLVKEIFFLPELTPIAEAPIDIVGILNLRGKIVPIMHLDLRLGNSIQECKISDRVIVLECDGLIIGVVVNDVKEVRPIASNIIETTLDYGRISKINPAFIAGVAKEKDESIILLDSQALIREPDAVKNLADEGQTEEDFDSRATIITVGNFYQSCCPNATPQEKAIFRRRAENLRQASFEETSEVAGQMPVAVIGLGGEHFGIDLDTVREFINVRSYTPIPCCPKHIVGNMNLRGEILTLVDIRSALNLPATTVNTGTKAVVIHVDDIVAGLPVDEVLDVTYLHPETVNPVPVAVPAGSEAYLKGTVSYQEKTLSLIDLPALMAKGELIVDEKV